MRSGESKNLSKPYDGAALLWAFLVLTIFLAFLSWCYGVGLLELNVLYISDLIKWKILPVCFFASSVVHWRRFYAKSAACCLGSLQIIKQFDRDRWLVTGMILSALFGFAVSLIIYFISYIIVDHWHSIPFRLQTNVTYKVELPPRAFLFCSDKIYVSSQSSKETGLCVGTFRLRREGRLLGGRNIKSGDECILVGRENLFGVVVDDIVVVTR